MNSKRVKKENEYLANKEIAELNEVIVLVVEADDLLEQLEADSIQDFENSLHALTKFTNPMISAQAFNLDSEYNRLLELQKLINGRLTSKDLTASKGLKKSLIAKIKESNRQYYTEAELTSKKALEDVIKTFNDLSYMERQQLGFNHSNELVFSPFSEFRF